MAGRGTPVKKPASSGGFFSSLFSSSPSPPVVAVKKPVPSKSSVSNPPAKVGGSAAVVAPKSASSVAAMAHSGVVVGAMTWQEAKLRADAVAGPGGLSPQEFVRRLHEFVTKHGMSTTHSLICSNSILPPLMFDVFFVNGSWRVTKWSIKVNIITWLCFVT
jgi:hypothetical protein